MSDEGRCTWEYPEDCPVHGEREALRALSEAATPGPWVAEPGSGGKRNDGTTWPREWINVGTRRIHVRGEPDADFIAAAVNYVRALLAAAPAPTEAGAYKPREGDPVQVTITGRVSRHDVEAGHIYVNGNAPGQEHVEWEWCFHWATEFERPGQPGKNEGERAGLVGREVPTSPSSPLVCDLHDPPCWYDPATGERL